MKRQSIQIGDQSVGEAHPMFLIAEVGLGHDGSLGTAHAFIDAAANCGVDAIKFQTHIASEESSAYEKFRVNVFPQDESRPSYWQRTAFDKNQWLELAAHCTESKIHFLSSPFSDLAVQWLKECETPAWKVASGEVSNLPMLEKMAETGKPILLSSGMSSWQELQRAVDYLQQLDACFAVFQCTTSYPCPPESWGLNVITEMRERFACPVGLSDHSGTMFPGLGARMLGASLLEFHITFHKQQFGPDVKASLTLEQTSQLVDGIRQLERAMANPVDKDSQAEQLTDLRGLFSKSLFAAGDLAPGDVLSENNVCVRKPLIGIPASDWSSTLGRVVAKPIANGEPIFLESLQ